MGEKFIFFWNGPFSQWHPSNFMIDGDKYNSAEQYMMASKARFFGDKDAEASIMETDNPREQKKLGRKVKGFNSERWNAFAKDFVYDGNYAKFTQNKRLLEKLIATAGSTLVEASPYDCVWGIGMSEDEEGIENRENWRGTNWLGEILTGLREDLIEESERSEHGRRHPNRNLPIVQPHQPSVCPRGNLFPKGDLQEMRT